MKVKHLIEALRQFPENMDVFVGERVTEFTYGLVNSVKAKEIVFYDGPDCDDSEIKAKETVVIIEEL